MKVLSLSKAAITHAKVSLMRRIGFKTNRHIVVFESDDWGSIRMPSLNVAQKIKNNGFELWAPNTYDRYDTLETNDDLTFLMEVLNSVKDKNRHPARITMNCVMGNPDFAKIKESEFSQYYYEPFYETYKRYPHCNNSFSLIKEGIENGLFKPQFHGREHLNSFLWMQGLKNKNAALLMGFDECCFSIAYREGKTAYRVLDAFNIDDEIQYLQQKESIEEGLRMFKETFGYESTSMIAPCYTWDDYTEEIAAAQGVRFIQGNPIQHHSRYWGNRFAKSTLHWMGQKNNKGQLYMIRNCSFEPSDKPENNVDRCKRDIEKQFELSHPVVVSCHRQNFIGENVVENRDNNLRNFKSLLTWITDRYPDVEFMSSDELGETIIKTQL